MRKLLSSIDIRSAEPPVSRLGRRGYNFFCLGLQHLFLSNLVLHLNGIVLGQL